MKRERVMASRMVLLIIVGLLLLLVLPNAASVWNLIVLETRSRGETSISERPRPR